MSIPISYTQRHRDRIAEVVADVAAWPLHRVIGRMVDLELRVEDANALLDRARLHVESQNQAEHMLDGFGGRRPRPSDALLEEIERHLGIRRLNGGSP